jgi:hypothetical protein
MLKNCDTWRVNTAGLAILARCSLAVALLLSINLSAAAQSAAARPERGIAPANSYAVSDIENVNLTNGNLGLSIPLAALPPMKGGKLSWVLRAIYNSKSWDIVRSEIQPNPESSYKYTVSELQLSGVSSWIIGGRYEISFQDSDDDYEWIRPACQQCIPNVCEHCDTEYNLLTQNRWTKVVLTTPDGATHELRPTDYSPYNSSSSLHPYLRGYYKDNPSSTNAAMRYYSFDGSHLWVKIDSNQNLFNGNVSSWTLYLPDGTKVVQSADGVQRITDTNGNKIKIWSSGTSIVTTRYQDELTGREIKFVYDPNGNNGQGSRQVKYQTVEGGWVNIDVNMGTTRVQGKIYHIGDALCGDAGRLIDHEIPVVLSIVLPQTEANLARKQFT